MQVSVLIVWKILKNININFKKWQKALLYNKDFDKLYIYFFEKSTIYCVILLHMKWHHSISHPFNAFNFFHSFPDKVEKKTFIYPKDGIMVLNCTTEWNVSIKYWRNSFGHLFKHVSPWLYFFVFHLNVHRLPYFSQLLSNRNFYSVFVFYVTLCFFLFWNFLLVRLLPFSVTNFEMELHLFQLQTHCVPRAPVCEVWSRPYLFAYCLNTYKTMHYVRFRPLNLNVALRQWRNRTECGRYLNNRRTGKDATKPHTLGSLDTGKIKKWIYFMLNVSRL